MNIDPKITEYIQLLTLEYHSIKAIWLLGSRVNNSFRYDSDWDLLVFSDQEMFTQLKKNNALKNDSIDLLVLFDGENFESPWPYKKGPKTGSLTSWGWQQLSLYEASYKSVKYKCEEEWYKANMLETKTLKAIRLWP